MANIKKETHIVWYKDDREIMVDEEHDFKDGVCTLLISEVGAGPRCLAAEVSVTNSGE